MKDDDTSSETSGDTDASKDKSRKSSSNTDDIPQQEKGWLCFHGFSLWFSCDEAFLKATRERKKKSLPPDLSLRAVFVHCATAQVSCTSQHMTRLSLVLVPETIVVSVPEAECK